MCAMKRMLLLLALAGCDARDESAPAQSTSPMNGTQPGALPAVGASASPDQLAARAKAALDVIITDPEMRFANVRAGAANAVCGDVEAKQPDGKRGVRPFVITPEGVAVVSATQQVSIGDPEDPFPDFYIRWCASPAELARLQPNMIGGETLGLGAPPPDIPDVPPDLPTELPPPTPPPEPERPAARVTEPPPRPPAPTSDDSFFNAVARPAGKDGP
jgi:hypothetical protein